MILLWLKKHWKWVLTAVAVGAAFLIGFFSRRPKVISPSQEIDDKRREIEEDAEEKRHEAETARDQEIREVEADHREAIQDLTESQEERAEELKDDPAALSEWLRSVGKRQQ